MKRNPDPVPARPVLQSLATFLLLPSILFSAFPFILPGCGWKRQTVLYRHRADPDRRIEFQLQGAGAFGWNRRYVEITPGCLFDEIREIDIERIDTLEWRPVDEWINEAEFKGG